MRVTHVVFDFEGGGLESIVAELARRLPPTTCRTSVVTLSGRPGRQGEAVRAHLDHLVPFRPARGVSLVAPVGLARAIRATAPDVVHLHSGAWLKPARAARWAGVPRVIFTEHGREHDDPPLARWLDRRAAKLTDVVVAVSQRLGRYLVDGVGIEPKRVTVIPNGVDTSRFAPGAAPADLLERLRLPAGSVLIGSVGRLEAVKAFHRLIAAFAHLRATRADMVRLRLVIAGEGSARASLERQVHEMGLGDVVRLPGWHDNPAELYRSLSAFALTSLSEGMSMSLLEAMASGAPPVVTNVGANAELLGPELSSFVVDEHATPEVIGEALGRAVDAGRTGAGAQARQRVERHFSMTRMVESYASLYRGNGR